MDIDIPGLSDVAVRLFLPVSTIASTSHVLAKQTSYVSEPGDSSAPPHNCRLPELFAAGPFLTGVDVFAPAGAGAIVAFGHSTTDGDGSSVDENRRYTDVFADRLQRAGGPWHELGVLNQGIIGNRMLKSSPDNMKAQFGLALGESALARFDREVLGQPGVEFFIVAHGVNDILFPGSMTPASEQVRAADLIGAYRELIRRAHARRIRVIGTTITPFDGATLGDPAVAASSAVKERVRRCANQWILSGDSGFDGVADFDSVARDPAHPARLDPRYHSGDHLHMNDAGYAAAANAIRLTFFRGKATGVRRDEIFACAA